MKLSRRWFLTLLLLTACRTQTIARPEAPLTIGMIKDDQSAKSIHQYDRFKDYVREKMQTIVEIEPVLNEDRALERIRSSAWSLVFAPPGLAAIAISQYQYVPLFPLEGVQNLRSAIVVREDSPIQELSSLAGKAIVLGQPGSATGYYLPLFNLYGLTLAQLRLAPTPKAVLELVAQGKATAGALSVAEFDTYSDQVESAKFRFLFVDPHAIPPGVLLLSPNIDQNRAEQLRQKLQEVDSVMAEQIGLITNAPVPDYQYLISVVERVRAIFPGDTAANAALLQQKPIRLFNQRDAKIKN